ncbi:MAG: hypothetical protein ACR2IN_01120 [Thermoleophilaceae bacterium]|jgi:hypothetical protein|nr:hypothetical protein [Thermoleophilaceae bacterium]
MYQFSRSMYRELASDVAGERITEVSANRARVLRSCEEAVERLATDPHYFARPSRTLFRDVRSYFPMCRQLRVYEVIDRHMNLAGEYVDRAARAGVRLDGAPLSCHATTRRGTACQRVPLPGSQYCPSHKHLDEDFQIVAA